MKKRTSLMIAGLLAASLGSAAVIADHGKRGDCDRGDRDGGYKSMRHHDGFGKHMKRAEFMEREFSADEIRTLAEARLIMKGNENLKVGKIKTTDEGYVINIVTQDDSLVEEREVAKNGMPMDMYKHMMERKEKRKEMKKEKRKERMEEDAS